MRTDALRVLWWYYQLLMVLWDPFTYIGLLLPELEPWNDHPCARAGTLSDTVKINRLLATNNTTNAELCVHNSWDVLRWCDANGPNRQNNDQGLINHDVIIMKIVKTVLKFHIMCCLLQVINMIKITLSKHNAQRQLQLHTVIWPFYRYDPCNTVLIIQW